MSRFYTSFTNEWSGSGGGTSFHSLRIPFIDHWNILHHHGPSSPQKVRQILMNQASYSIFSYASFA